MGRPAGQDTMAAAVAVGARACRRWACVAVGRSLPALLPGSGSRNLNPSPPSRDLTDAICQNRAGAAAASRGNIPPADLLPGCYPVQGTPQGTAETIGLYWISLTPMQKLTRPGHARCAGWALPINPHAIQDRLVLFCAVSCGSGFRAQFRAQLPAQNGLSIWFNKIFFQILIRLTV